MTQHPPRSSLGHRWPNAWRACCAWHHERASSLDGSAESRQRAGGLLRRPAVAMRRLWLRVRWSRSTARSTACRTSYCRIVADGLRWIRQQSGVADGRCTQACATPRRGSAQHILRGFLPSQALPERVWASLGYKPLAAAGCLAQLHTAHPPLAQRRQRLTAGQWRRRHALVRAATKSRARTPQLAAGKRPLPGGRHARPHARTSQPECMHIAPPLFGAQQHRRPLLRVRALLSLRLSPWPHARPRPGRDSHSCQLHVLDVSNLLSARLRRPRARDASHAAHAVPDPDPR